MSSPFLTPQQEHEQAVRISGSKPIEEVFSAQIAKQIMHKEELIFQILCIKNALELGYPDMALAQCNKALRRA